MTRGEENGVRLGGKKQGWPNWTTPKEVLDSISEIGVIALDPCSNEHSQVCAPLKLAEHGLVKSWVELLRENKLSGITYVNPPYNRAKEFVRKCIIEQLSGVEIIALLASRTDTQWTKACLQTGDALCFWEGRIHFENPPPDSEGDAPSIPSVLYYWGPRRWEFCRAFDKHGFCMDLRQIRQRQTMYQAGGVSP